MIDPEEIDRMAARFFESAYTILDPARTEVRYNGEWLGQLDFAGVLRLARTTTVARLLERDDFAKRFVAQQAISVSELLYPLMQAYDSVAIDADVELGGTDQLFNLMVGRDLGQGFKKPVHVEVYYPETQHACVSSQCTGDMAFPYSSGT